MKKEISFGKIDFCGSGRRINEVTVEIKLTDEEKPRFSVYAYVWNSKHSDIICCGQCLDTIQPYLKSNKKYNEIVELWQKYHLNDMHAGTEKQEEYLGKVGLLNASKYNEACAELEKVGLLVDNGYKYGTKWLYRAIPQKDLERIKEILA